jgi:P-type E1-E2 ATPase
VYRSGGFVKTEARDIYVGDIVLVENDLVFPCDLILLSAANENGVAWIETASIDGEKNLKPR